MSVLLSKGSIAQADEVVVKNHKELRQGLCVIARIPGNQAENTQAVHILAIVSRREFVQPLGQEVVLFLQSNRLHGELIAVRHMIEIAQGRRAKIKLGTVAEIGEKRAFGGGNVRNMIMFFYKNSSIFFNYST